jgi:tetratricopeptide (TPR) repeat protein
MVPGKIEKLLLKAKQAIAARDWEKAKQAYLMALGFKSDLPDIHYGLATVYFQLQELTSAAHHFKEVTRLDPLRAGAYINLGAVHNLLNQYDEAIAALRRGIQIDPQRVEGYYNLGLVYRHKGQVDLAIQAYREAIRLNPRMADAHLNLANLLLDKGQLRTAMEHYDHCLALRPGWDKALDGRAHVGALLNPQDAEETLPVVARTAKHEVEELDRLVDPTRDADLLTWIHSGSTDAETYGKQIEQVLTEEVEPVVKELGVTLLNPDGSRIGLHQAISHFEVVVARLRELSKTLHDCMKKLEQHAAEHFPRPDAKQPSS